MAEVLWLGVALGVGQALAVGPVFLAIVQQSIAQGVGAGCRVTLGATACNALRLLSALLFAGTIGGIGSFAPWLAGPGALCFIYLGQATGRDAHRLWRGGGPRSGRALGPFWQGLVGGLANPLAWTVWIAAVVPALLHAQQTGGNVGPILFLAAWLGATIGMELLIALVSARGAGFIGVRGQACVCAIAALLFFGLAGQLVANALPYFFAA